MLRLAVSRVFVLGLALLAGLPLVADTQLPGQLPKIAYLSAASAGIDTVEAFRQGLRELGYVEGRNILIEYRWADGRFDRLPVLAAELVRLRVDVIVAANTPAAVAAKNATSTTPIVLVTSGDPVGSGLVAGLARPGGNVTGLSLTPSLSISGKQLAVLEEAFPAITQVAVLANPTNQPTLQVHRANQARVRAGRCRLVEGCLRVVACGHRHRGQHRGVA